MLHNHCRSGSKQGCPVSKSWDRTQQGKPHLLEALCQAPAFSDSLRLCLLPLLPLPTQEAPNRLGVLKRCHKLGQDLGQEADTPLLSSSGQSERLSVLQGRHEGSRHLSKESSPLQAPTTPRLSAYTA